jgi:Glycosyl transferase family 2
LTVAPVILFVYNRPEHTRLTVEALQRNTGAQAIDLYIFSDGPKGNHHAESVKQVRAYLPAISGFKSVRIVERESNMGLAASIIAGVTGILQTSPSCIVLEDDMVTSPNFLEFMNSALTTYQQRQDVFSVTGYNYPLPIPADYPEDAYLSYRGSSWGWGTWSDRWNKVDWAVSDYAEFSADTQAQELFARAGNDLPGMLKMQMDGKLDSWAIRFDYAHHKHDAYCLHAIKSKVQNIGFDGSGVHCAVSDVYQVQLDPADTGFKLRPDLQLDSDILKIFDARFRPQDRIASGDAVSKIDGQPPDLGAVSRAWRAARKLLHYIGLTH